MDGFNKDTAQTVRQFICRREPGSQTVGRSPPGVRTDIKQGLKLFLQKNFELIGLVCRTVYAPGHW